MTNVVTLIAVLAVSIGLGIVLSWYMGFKLMRTESAKKLVKQLTVEYGHVTAEATEELLKKDSDKFKQMMEDLA